ncbi:MAG TPA: Mu transposase C-terminal domain-containing protein [Lacunisphaera sp.]|nr:Mu transposase C-terminal domain-containing protein [Lacunisphaera sp.]
MNDIADISQESGSASGATATDDCHPAASTGRLYQIGPDMPRVTECALPNQAEKSIESGKIRLRWLMPLALSRLGMSYELWDPAQQKMVVHDERLPISRFVRDLAAVLKCGPDLIYHFVDKLAKTPGGPHNAKATDLLKSAQGGGSGTSRLGDKKDEVLNEAVWEVRVTRGIKPGRKAMKEIRKLLGASAAFANQPLPSPDTIAKRWNTDAIKVANANPYERDHLHRMCGEPDKILGLNAVMCIDCATMSNDECEVRVLDEQDRDLGPATCVWGINAATRGVMTVLGYPGAQNGFLVGQAIRLALIDKTPLLKEYGLEGYVWPFHGKPGEIRHDRGSEFINQHVERALQQRDIGIPVNDSSPAKTPHYRGGSERFHQSAQWLFAEFLDSPAAKKVLRSVKGKPKAKGIRLKDLNPALVTWVVQDWHNRSLSALGGDSPLSRWEKFVQGKNGLPASGVPPALEDSNDFRYEFLWVEHRTVNQLGIQFQNRNYRSDELNCFLKPNSRSSGKKVEFRFNPYVMGEIRMKVKDEDGDRIVSIPWVPIDDKFRPTTDLAARSKNPTYWEWKHLYQDLVKGNTATPSPKLMEDMQRHREEQAETGRLRSKRNISDNAREAMRGFAADSLPEARPSRSSPPVTQEHFMPDAPISPPPSHKSRELLPVGDNGNLEY